MGWNKGPLPPDTWQWGGVVLKDFDTHGYMAFFFADFCGDHVVLQDGRVIKPDEIAWWNNDITLPEREKMANASVSVEELRKTIVKGIDDALSRPIISRFISAESAKIMRAQRAFWQDDDGAQLAKLVEIYNREP